MRYITSQSLIGTSSLPLKAYSRRTSAITRKHVRNNPNIRAASTSSNAADSSNVTQELEDFSPSSFSSTAASNNPSTSDTSVLPSSSSSSSPHRSRGGGFSSNFRTNDRGRGGSGSSRGDTGTVWDLIDSSSSARQSYDKSQKYEKYTFDPHYWVFKRDVGPYLRLAEKGVRKWLGKTPFPSNPTFSPPPPLPDTLKQEIWLRYQADQSLHTIPALANEFKVGIDRVEAIIRLKKNAQTLPWLTQASSMTELEPYLCVEPYTPGRGATISESTRDPSVEYESHASDRGKGLYGHTTWNIQSEEEVLASLDEDSSPRPHDARNSSKYRLSTEVERLALEEEKHKIYRKHGDKTWEFVDRPLAEFNPVKINKKSQTGKGEIAYGKARFKPARYK